MRGWATYMSIYTTDNKTYYTTRGVQLLHTAVLEFHLAIENTSKMVNFRIAK